MKWFLSDCSGLVAPAYGSLSSKAASHGNHVTVSCNTGYKLSGERTLVCSSGSWSGNIGTCEVEEGISCKCIQYFNKSYLRTHPNPRGGEGGGGGGVRAPISVSFSQQDNVFSFKENVTFFISNITCIFFVSVLEKNRSFIMFLQSVSQM